MLILGIETSCDETAAAVVQDGKKILSSIVSSQIEVHSPYGGVVPELASRKHMEDIVPVVEDALEKSAITNKQIDAVASTRGPGLVGSLLVGFSFAKAYAYALNVPWIGVNHLEGHIHSVFLENNPPDFPFVVLLASGGHTNIYYATTFTEFEQMGQTRDDAAGEAFDKVAKMLELGYPGGGVIDKLAKQGDPNAVSFPRPFLDKSGFDFSFSGIKTSVNRYLQKNKDTYKNHIPDIVAGFQEAVVEVLSYKIVNAAKTRNCKHIALVGGVAANSRLREKVTQEAEAQGISIHIPSIDLCGDNAAMIASVGYHYLKRNEQSDLDADVFSRTK
ncbi:MAG: tRNA (adenosine(37)-N6)-threonylcarbamoyltransferase complex transferase subunit TsaD [Deltaproteobacteria bacterium]|nr:tRNA (adenosine(37)-N6)-threonylcarbamoyltransferase complex transferase subunit TsaD [Deltaproteobacteria bacterium]MBW1846272.1 tRNA (adenosine(37)-N6)-threonylcarbamoyltransferase complex transferase subunit TsaD [Deltaproteobacteria bacterium]MBW1984738.1 tRNA (adenosine(37)-N6)-threonylcarbamoyltransferase complex transferase subunit TsaD [Deltaproteobacteria bacterium]